MREYMVRFVRVMCVGECKTISVLGGYRRRDGKTTICTRFTASFNELIVYILYAIYVYMVMYVV